MNTELRNLIEQEADERFNGLWLRPADIKEIKDRFTDGAEFMYSLMQSELLKAHSDGYEAATHHEDWQRAWDKYKNSL